MPVCYPLELDYPITQVSNYNWSCQFFEKLISDQPIDLDSIDLTEIKRPVHIVDWLHRMPLLETVILLKTERKQLKHQIIKQLLPHAMTSLCYHFALYMATHDGDMELLKLIGLPKKLKFYQANLLPHNDEILEFFHQVPIHKAACTPGFLEVYLNGIPESELVKKTNGGYTALDIAMSMGLMESINLLVKAGATVNFVHGLVTHSWLLGMDIPEEIVDKYDKGKTALHLAIEHDNVNMVQWLLKLGADVKLPTKDGKYWWQMVSGNNLSNMGRTLVQVPGATDVINYDIVTLHDILWKYWMKNVSKDWGMYHYEKYRHQVRVNDIKMYTTGLNSHRYNQDKNMVGTVMYGGSEFEIKWSVRRETDCASITFNNYGRNADLLDMGFCQWRCRSHAINIKVYKNGMSEEKLNQIMKQATILLNLDRIKKYETILGLYCLFTICGNNKYLPIHLRKQIGNYVLVKS